LEVNQAFSQVRIQNTKNKVFGTVIAKITKFRGDVLHPSNNTLFCLLPMTETITIHHTLIGVEPEHALMAVIWTRPILNQDYRDLWDKILPIAEKYHITRWLLDQREMGPMMPADMQWVVEDWYPRSVKKLGKHRRSAIVVSKNIFGELTVKKGINGLKETQDLESRFFDDPDAARQWLLL
jgi:hypothetical protein